MDDAQQADVKEAADTAANAKAIDELYANKLSSDPTVDTVLDERAFTGNLHGVARPSAFLRPAMRELHDIVEGEGSLNITMNQAMDEGAALVSLAALIDSGIERFKRPDGSIDSLMVAAHILKRIAPPGDMK